TIVAVSGERLTLATAPTVKGGEPVTREITVTPNTRLSFFNVGPGGAQLTLGDHVRGWLVEGSDDTTDELAVSRWTQFDDTKAAGNPPADPRPDAKRYPLRVAVHVSNLHDDGDRHRSAGAVCGFRHGRGRPAQAAAPR